MQRNRQIAVVVAVAIAVVILFVALILLGGYWLASRPRVSPSTFPSTSTSIRSSQVSSPGATPIASVFPLVVPGSVASPWTTNQHAKVFSGTVPPLPLLMGLRTATHADGYDRIAFDFRQDRSPGYTIGYVSRAVRDGSGEAVDLPGNAILQIVFNPATAHDDSGKTPAKAPTSPVTVSYPGLQSYAMTGDFEGHVTFAFGTTTPSGYRISEFQKSDGAWTIYIDIKH